MLQDFMAALPDDPGRLPRKRLLQGEILIEEGDTATSVFVLVDGALEVTRTVGETTTKVAEITEPGTVVGEMVSMGGGTRSATVVASVDTEVLRFSSEEFTDILEASPDLTVQLAEAAIRRAEVTELAEILANHFGVTDEDDLLTTCGLVEWERLRQGDVLLREGENSDAVYFVVRGRLAATRADPLEGDVEIGEAGRGGVVGELGLLGNKPRGATLTATRDTVVARLDEQAFFDLVDRQPRLMVQVCLNAVERAETQRWQTASTSVLALAVGASLDVEPLLMGVDAEMKHHGAAVALSADRVDRMLDRAGVADAGHGEVGDVRVSRLLHELELEADHMVLALDQTRPSWANRAIGMADRLALVLSSAPTERELIEIEDMLMSCPVGLRRTLVRFHPAGRTSPTDTGGLMDRLGADEVIHIEEGSRAGMQRLARVLTGNGSSLVLGGGGGRGFAHIGVLRAMEQLELPVDIVGGTSIGGIIGSAIANGLSSDQLVEWAKKSFGRSLDYTVPVVALLKGGRMTRAARETFGERDIEDLWLRFFCISTNLSTAKMRVHDRGSIASAVRATSALPGVLPPVPDGDDLLVDGGVFNNLPMDIARRVSPRGTVVAVDVAPVRGPGSHGDFGLSVSGWSALGASVGSGRRRYPRIGSVLMRSMIGASMHERDRQVSEGLADCYLDLDMRGISMLDFDDPAGVAQRGYDAAMPVLEDWLAGKDR